VLLAEVCTDDLTSNVDTFSNIFIFICTFIRTTRWTTKSHQTWTVWLLQQWPRCMEQYCHPSTVTHC